MGRLLLGICLLNLISATIEASPSELPPIADTLPTDFNRLREVTITDRPLIYFSIFEDSEGFIWLSTEDGVYVNDGTEFLHCTSDENGPINQIVEDSLGNIVFSYKGIPTSYAAKNKKLLRHLSPCRHNCDTTTWVPPSRNIPARIPFIANQFFFNNDSVSTIHRTFEYGGDFFAGTKDGKLIYHRIEVGQNRISVLDTKSGNPIYDFLVDRSGAWWILGRKNVWIYAPDRVETGVKVIDTINHEKGAIWEMRVLRNVVHILSAKAGMSQLWNWELEQPSEVVPLLETPLSMFAKHFFYDDTSLILAGREGIIYDVTIGKFFQIDAVVECVIENSFLYDNDRVLLVNGLGLVFYDDLEINPPEFENKEVKQLHDKYLKTAYSSLAVGDDQFLINALTGGLNMVEFDGRNIVSITHYDYDKIPEEVITVCQDNIDSSYVWVGTQSDGLYLFDWKEEVIKAHFDRSNGLINEKIYSIVCFGNDVWFNSQQGPGYLHRRENIYLVGEADGLPDLDGAGTSSAVVGDTILFGTDEGVIYFNPATLASELLERGKRTFPGKLTIAPIVDGKMLETSDTVRIERGADLAFSVVGFDHQYQDLLRFRYVTTDNLEEIPPDSLWKPVLNSSIQLDSRSKAGEDFYVLVQARSTGDWAPYDHVFCDIDRPRYEITILYIIIAALLAGLGIFVSGEYRRRKEATQISFAMLDSFFKNIRPGPYPIDQVKDFFLDMLAKNNISPYITAFTHRVGEDKFRVIKYYDCEEEEWIQHNETYLFNGTFNGEAYSNKRIVEVPDVDKPKYLKQFGVTWRSKIFAPKEERLKSLLCFPIVNEETGKIDNTLVLQFDVPKRHRSVKIKFLKKCTSYLVELMGIDQLNRPAHSFMKQLEIQYNDWPEELLMEFHFHKDTFWRPPHFRTLDVLFSTPQSSTDWYLSLKNKKGIYDQDHPVNLVLKGLAGPSRSNGYQHEGASVSLGAILLMFTAVFERTTENRSDMVFRSIWSPQYDQFKEDFFRNNCLKRETKDNPTDLLQAAYHLGECLFYRKGRSNVVRVNLSLERGQFELYLKLDNPKKLSERLSKNPDLPSTVNGDATHAICQFRSLAWDEALSFAHEEYDNANFKLTFRSPGTN